MAHPGLCAFRDEAILSDAHVAAKALRALLKGAASGDPYCLLAQRQDESEAVAVRHFVLGHYRGSGPCVTILARSSYDPPFLSIDSQDGDFSWAVDVSLVAELFRALADQPGDSPGQTPNRVS